MKLFTQLQKQSMLQYAQGIINTYLRLKVKINKKSKYYKGFHKQKYINNPILDNDYVICPSEHFEISATNVSKLEAPMKEYTCWKNTNQTPDKSMVNMNDNYLELFSYPNKNTHQIEIGVLDTNWKTNGESGYTFKYGTIDIIFSLYGDSKTWPAIWLFGLPGPPEIDILEWLDTKNSLATTLHWGSDYESDHSQRGKKYPAPDWTQKNHLKLEWNPWSLKFYLNDILYRTEYKNVPTNYMYFIANAGYDSYMDISNVQNLSIMNIYSLHISPKYIS